MGYLLIPGKARCANTVSADFGCLVLCLPLQLLFPIRAMSICSVPFLLWCQSRCVLAMVLMPEVGSSDVQVTPACTN